MLTYNSLEVVSPTILTYSDHSLKGQCDKVKAMLIIHPHFPITTLVYEFSIYMYVNNLRKGTSYWSNLKHLDPMTFFKGLWPNPMTRLNLKITEEYYKYIYFHEKKTYQVT